MIEIISADETSIQEADLIQFLIRWKSETTLPQTEFEDILEHVTFTWLSQEEYFQFINNESILPSVTRVKSLIRAKKIHDGPTTTRDTGTANYS